jgi:hypothetical protein
MARFADQQATPQSRRSGYDLRWHGGSDLPWSDEVLDLIDEIAAEHLPEHLLAHVLEPKRAEQAEREQGRALLDRAIEDPSALNAQELEDAREAAYEFHGGTDAVHDIVEKLDDALDALNAQAVDDTDPTAGEEPVVGDEEPDAGTGGELPADAELAAA